MRIGMTDPSNKHASNTAAANEVRQVNIDDTSLNVQSAGAPLSHRSTGNEKAAVNITANTSADLPNDIAFRIAHAISIESTSENIQFIEKQGFSTAGTFAKLIKLLQMTESHQVLEEMGTSLLSIEDLPLYLKGLNEKSLGVILERLNVVIEKALSDFQSSPSTTKELIQLYNDLAKGLVMQLQHPFPFSFIPFIIIDDGKPQTGEAWIKKDGQCIYLWLDTDSLGSISIYINDSEKGLTIEFTGSPNTSVLLRKNKTNLIKALQRRQIKLHSLTFNVYGDGHKPMSILARHLSIKLPIDLGV